MLALAAVFLLVHVSAYWIRFDTRFLSEIWLLFQATWSLFLSVKLSVFMLMGLARRWWRPVNFSCVLQIVRAVIVAAVVVAVADYLLWTKVNVPRSVFFLDAAGTILVIGGVQAASRWAVERCVVDWLMGRQRTRALIVGTGDAAEVLQRAIERSPMLHYRIVGLVAETPVGGGSRVGASPIVGAIDQLPHLLQRFAVEELLVIDDRLPGKAMRDILEVAQAQHVNVRVIPSYERLLSGSAEIRPRQVAIEDLLRREPVQLDDERLHHWINGKTILVTGSAGSIGSEICRQLLRFGPARLVAVDRSESGQFFLEQELRSLQSTGDGAQTCDVETVLADLNEPLRIRQVIADYGPQIIFHAAAYKHVPLLERQPGEAVKNITLATQHIVDAVASLGAEVFVLISTDKAVQPRSVMGACKRLAELYVLAHRDHPHCRFITVRFGNVLNSAGSVIQVFQQQIARGGPLTITHPEMKRYFMTIPEAAQLVLQAGRLGRSGQILVLDMGEPVRIVDLARDMIRLSGLREEQVGIEFVGLRPGEKLQEELCAAHERLQPTSHPKIRGFMAAGPSVHELRQRFAALHKTAVSAPEHVVAQLQQILPEYEPQERHALKYRGRHRAA